MSRYTRTYNFPAGQKARGTEVRQELDAVQQWSEDMPDSDDVWSGNVNYAAAAGTANAITVLASNTWTTYVGKDGYKLALKIALDNTGAVTVNVDSLGAVSAVRNDGTALQAGDLKQNGVFDFTYNESQEKFYVTAFNGIAVASAASAAASAASAAAALVSENAAAGDAAATAADRVQTGLDVAATNADVVATNADRVQTGLDVDATNADVISTAADRVQTGLDVVATNADVVSTNADAAATAADRVQTGLDVVATAADRVQTGLDVISTNADAASAETDRILAQSAATQAEAHQEGAETALAAATAVVVSGDVSYTPAANQVPLARSTGKIDSHWIQNAAYSGNAVSLDSTAATGCLIPDDTEAVFTPSMWREYTAYIPRTLTTEMILYSEPPFGIYITTDKRVRINIGATYESDPLEISDDTIVIDLTRYDNEVDTTTVTFGVAGVQYGATIVSDFSDEYIRSLFDSADGFYWLASPGYSDKANTGGLKTELPGDTAGLIYDLGANGINGSQATGTARPLLGRVPLGGRRNLVVDSELFTSGNWSKTNVTVTAVDTPSGQPQVFKIVPNSSSGAHVLFQFVGQRVGRQTASFDLKRAELQHAFVAVTRSSNSTSQTAIIDLDTGLVTDTYSTTGTPTITISPNPLPGDVDWYRVSVSGVNSTGNMDIIDVGAINRDTVLPVTNQRPSFTGDSVSGILVRRAQMELDVESAYQRVGTTARDITESGVQSVNYYYFDKSDDVINHTVPAMTDATIVLAGTNGIWINTIASVSAGTFSIGPLVYTSGSAGMLPLIGDVVGGLLRDPQLTTPELTQVVELLKAQGAPGWFSLDATELLTNGTFDSDTVWVDLDTGTGDSVISGGVLTITGVDTSNRGIRRQAITTVVGQEYKFTASPTTISGTPAPAIIAGTSATFGTGTLFSSTATNNYSMVFTATTTTTYVFLYTSGNGVVEFDNASVKALTLNTGVYS